MTTTNWVIVTNSNLARIYRFNPEKITGSTHLLAELIHPLSRAKIEQFISGRPGHFKTREPASRSFVPHTDPHEVEVEAFAKEIADKIEEGRVHNQYKGLILIGLPHFIGHLEKHLSSHSQKCILKTIHKDHSLSSLEEIEALLKQTLFH